MAELRQNTWSVNAWYEQDYAGNASYESIVNELWAWGLNDYGSLGQGNQTNYSSPVQIPGTTWATIGSARQSAAATKSDGTLWTWGRNTSGNLATGAQTNTESPVQVPGTTWNGGCAGDDVGMYTKSDGTLWTVGSSPGGKLGQNNSLPTASYFSPRQIPGTTWSRAPSVFAGSHSACFKTDGTLWMWGLNGYGQLGQNQANAQLASVNSPVQVPGTWCTDGVDNLCGSLGYYTLARKSDGTLWAWGDNEYGALGQGKTRQGSGHHQSSPVQIPGTTWAKVFCANSAEVAGGIKTDGTLWMWGLGGAGQLAQNNRTNYSSPVQIPGTNWAKVGLTHAGNSIATKTDGTLWAWGYAPSGNLGLNEGGIVRRSSPTQIPGDWGNSMLGGGEHRVFALKQF
tara:strand:- start:44 stop:1237 length:1194 start_codon:yes stop_codon:yes gene_type:complete